MAPLEWGSRVEPMLAEMAEQHPTRQGHPPHRRVRRRSARPDPQRQFRRGRQPAREVRLSLRDQRQPHADGHRPRVREAHPQCADDPRPLRQAGHRRGRYRPVPRRRPGTRQASQLWIKLSDLPVEADGRVGPRPISAPISMRRSKPSASTAPSMPAIIRSCLQATTLPRWVEVLDRAFADSACPRPTCAKSTGTTPTSSTASACEAQARGEQGWQRGSGERPRSCRPTPLPSWSTLPAGPRRPRISAAARWSAARSPSRSPTASWR